MKRLIKFLAVGILLFTINSTNFAGIPGEEVKEQPVHVENWMTTPLYYTAEETVEVENWMLVPFVMYDSPRLLTGEDYIVYNSEELYAYNGDAYEVYNVKYFNDKDIKIAVHGKTYIVLGENFTIFYECSKQGFGVRKIFFQSPEAMKELNVGKYQQQTILCKNRKINKLTAIEMIVEYFPQLKS